MSTCTRVSLVAAAVALLGGGAAADPLDKVTGTEDWHKAAPENPEQEWKDWYRARVEWRRASRELRIQRVVSHRLAKLLERIDPPTFGEVQRILRAGVGGVEPAPVEDPHPARAGRPAPRPRPRPARPPRPLPPAPPDAPAADETPEPGEWTKVPVEKLDKDGQVLDDEGERVLKKTYEKKPKKKK